MTCREENCTYNVYLKREEVQVKVKTLALKIEDLDYPRRIPSFQGFNLHHSVSQ